MELFKKLMEAQSFDNDDFQIRKIILDEIVDLPNLRLTWDRIGNIIVEKGEGPFSCFASHMDTVHHPTKKRKNKIKEERKGDDILWSSPTGVGGDDKCGVWACIKLLQELENVKVVFFAQEECGQIGSSYIDLSVFNDCCFICEIDRLGNDDLIVDYLGTTTVSEEFEDELVKSIPKKDLWVPTEGFITDVMVLFERGIEISVMNLSSGYYKPHSKNEYVSWKDMNKTLRMAREIAKLNDRIYSIENWGIWDDFSIFEEETMNHLERTEGDEFLFGEDGIYVGSEFPDDYEIE